MIGELSNQTMRYWLRWIIDSAVLDDRLASPQAEEAKAALSQCLQMAAGSAAAEQVCQWASTVINRHKRGQAIEQPLYHLEVAVDEVDAARRTAHTEASNGKR